MSVKLKAIECLYVNKHKERLAAARDRADAVNTRDTTLGDGERMKLMAATEAQSIEEIIKSAVVVKRLKRAALIQVRDLLYYCNQWGVMICAVPAWFELGQLNYVWGPSISFAGGPEILERLGVTKAYVTGGDYRYDYSACVESSVEWLA